MIGLCTGHPNPDLWYPEQPQGRPSNAKRKQLAEQVMLALAICHECPIRKQCLDEGMRRENLDYGIWGGMLAGERIIAAGVKANSTTRTDAIVFAEGVRKWQEYLLD